MTTIATDGKSMAGDTLTSGGGERLAYHQKIKWAKDGRIFGCCGDATDAALFAQWIDGEQAEPKLSEEFEALVLNTDGTVHYFNHKLVPVPYMVPMTVGSGAGLALGAMLAGKSPAEAVEIAKERDYRSGGDVTVLSIEVPVRAVA